MSDRIKITVEASINAQIEKVWKSYPSEIILLLNKKILK